MNKDKKLVFGVLALVVSLVAVSISYAAFTQNLNINGTANVKATAWDVHFANLSNAVRSGTAREITAPTIKASRTDIGDYSVSFATPGDYIYYTFDVVNDGDYDASISVFTLGEPTCSGTDATSNMNVCSHLFYVLFYTDDEMVGEGDTLKVGETRNMTLALAYSSSIDQSELPTSEVTVGNLGITIQYAQDSYADGINYRYATNYSQFRIGESILNNEVTYDNYESTSSNIFLRYEIKSGIISEAYVGFIKNGIVYYLKGGDFNAHDANKTTLINAFGTSNCEGDLALSNIDSKKILSFFGIPRIKALESDNLTCTESNWYAALNDIASSVREGQFGCHVNNFGYAFCDSGQG